MPGPWAHHQCPEQPLRQWVPAFCLSDSWACCVPGICNHQPTWAVGWPWFLLLDSICSSCSGAVGLRKPELFSPCYHCLWCHLPLGSSLLLLLLGRLLASTKCWALILWLIGVILVGFGGGFCFGLFSLCLASLTPGNCWEFLSMVLCWYMDIQSMHPQSFCRPDLIPMFKMPACLSTWNL